MFGAILSLAVPALALVLALRSTRRLQSSDPLPCPVPPIRGIGIVGVVGLGAGLAALVLMALREVAFFLPLVGTALLLLLAATVRVLSRHRSAGRPVVAAEVVGLLFIPSMMLAAFESTWRVAPPRPWWLLHATVLLGAGVSLWAVVYGRRALRVRGAVYFFGLFAALLVAWSVVGFVQDRPRDRADVLAWMEDFDADLDDAAAWDAFARAARWLGREGIALPDDVPAARRVRDAVASGCDVDGKTFVAAFDAGLLRGLDLSGCVPEDEPILSLVLGGNGFLSASEDSEARLRMAVAGGTVDDEARARLVDEVLGRWPGADEGRGLREAYEIVTDLMLLGAADRVAERREDAHALLGRHVCRTPYSFSRAGGFTAHRPEDGRCSSDSVATWYALALMRQVGVPDGVDLEALDAYVRGGVERGWLPTDAWNPLAGRERDEALLRVRFEASYDVPPSWRRVLWGLSGPFTLLCLVAFALVVVRRSPAVRVVPRSELPPRWPQHMVDAFPELRREEFLRRQR